MTDFKCYAVPQSPLPADLYGQDTDKDITTEEDDTFQFARNRPKYVNSGVVIGRVGDMKRLYKKLNNIWHTEVPDQIYDQGILAQVFGYQEYQRHMWADEHEREKETSSPWLPKSWYNKPTKLRNSSYTDPHPTRQRPNIEDGKSYQYAIGLDYWSELGIPTVFSDFDYDWVHFNDTSTIHAAWDAHNVTNPQSETLNEDIASSRLPFSALSSSQEQTTDNAFPSAPKQWQQQPLFSNLWTGVTPAVIHHNAHRDGLKGNRYSMWPKFWAQPYARELLKQRLEEGVMPYDVRDGAGEGWGFYTDKTDQGWLKWDEVCDAEMQNEIFRDGKGEFKWP